MKNEERIILAGGCFWGVEAFFAKIDGITKTKVGYIDGNKDNPTYEEVCSDSKHSEVVDIFFDSAKINLEEILRCLFIIIDPTSLNKQGNDEGVQYRSGVYYFNDVQKETIINFINKTQLQYEKKIVVEVKKASVFWKAEEYHQKYLNKNPQGYCHINLLKALKQVKDNKIK